MRYQLLIKCFLPSREKSLAVQHPRRRFERSQPNRSDGKFRIPGLTATQEGNGPAGTPACSTAPGTVTGTITPASVLAIPTQNITAGDFDALVDAPTSHTAYGNIRTVNFPKGEIRGEIRAAD
jgi:hypothetical protein